MMFPVLMMVMAILAVALIWRNLRGAAGKPSSSQQAPCQIPVRTPKGDSFDPSATRVFLRSAAAPGVPSRAGSAVKVKDGQSHLIGLTGTHQGQAYPLHGRGLVIGRNAACDIRLNDPRVSSRHAWIGIVDGRATLRDLKSTNGTFINASVDSPIHEITLHDNDTILLGGHLGDQFRYRQLPSQP
jgi:pSer/pThr/pTyr-binding forkhead associated (FHA) protein